jgi:hypothetical protein
VKPLEVKVPHALERDEVRRRLDEAVVKARDAYADQVRDLEATWESEDRLRVLLTVMGIEIESEIEILVHELVVRLELPAMAALFSGRIRDGIQERLGGLLGSQPA